MAEPAARRSVPITPGSSWRPGPPHTRFSLRVDLATAAARPAAGLPVSMAPCRAESVADWSALWLGPDEQLLIGPEHDGPAMQALVGEALRELQFSLVDVSHRQGAIEINGPRATALINSGCPLDLGIRQFPAGACTRTVFAKTEIVLWRRAVDNFYVEVWRSFMPYLAGVLSLAEAEFYS